MKLADALEDFTFQCECRRLSPQTIRNYQKQVSYLLDHLWIEHRIDELEAVTPQMVKQYLLVMQKKGRKPSYLNDLLKAFKCFFRYVWEEEYIDRLITAKIKNVKQPKVIIKTFSDLQVRQLLNYYHNTTYLDVRNKTLITLFFDTGMRLGEVINLTKEDIKRDFILVRHGKGEKERVVPKSPYLSKQLFRYERVKEGYFYKRAIPYTNYFLSKNGKPLTNEAVEKMLRVAGKDLAISDVRVSPHTCRHTFAQMQLRNGLDVYSLSRLMGHENISITQRYLEGLRDQEIIVAGTKTSPLMNLI